MSPRIHITYLGNVALKAIDIKFTVTTNLNLIADIQLIQAPEQDFQKEYHKFRNISDLTLNS